MSNTLMAKRYRSANPRAQIQHLCRIARRALAHADWIEELEQLYAMTEPAQTPEQLAEWQADVVASRAKASAAAEEVLAIAEANGIRPGHLQVVR